MLRLLHIAVAALLVLAAADVYRIKFESIREAEQVGKLRADIRHERDAIAALRAQWSELDRPDRIEELARRHLPLRNIEVYQFDRLDHLPDRPVEIVPPGTRDPIAAMIENTGEEPATGSLPDAKP